jgi:cyclopropane fatty-acyl-phospholipid synthase-like methyltransferase
MAGCRHFRMSEYRSHDVEWTPKKVGRVWSYYASNPAYRTQYFSAHTGGRILDRLEQAIDLRGHRILDFGCGRGDLLAQLYARDIAAAGLEFDEASARETEARLGAEPLFQGVVLASGLPSALPEASYDRVLLVEVIEHLLDDQVAPSLAEVRRLLTPGGMVAVTTVNGEDLDASRVRCPDCGATFHRWQHVRSFTPSSISELFEQQGFETVRAEGVYWDLTTLTAARLRLRRPRTPLPRPHLLYVGSAR